MEMDAVEKKSQSWSVQLVSELMEEILLRLPAKSLLRFRCVSKSWRSLIGSRRFIKNHLHNITKNQSWSYTYTYRRALFNCPTQHGLMQRSMQSYHDEPSVDPSPFDDPNNRHLTTAGVFVVGHCNGVLCIHQEQEPDSYFLWNPTTRISIELPKIKYGDEELEITKYGFGWDEESDAYKVFVGFLDDQDKDKDKKIKIGRVYSTKTKSWKEVEHGRGRLPSSPETGKFASGKIHWLSEGGLGIETFDLKSEVFGMVEYPCCYKPEAGVSMWLYNHSECLAVWSRSNNDDDQTRRRRLWVMGEEYGGAKDSCSCNWVEITIVQPAPAAITTTTTSCCYLTCFYIESLVDLLN